MATPNPAMAPDVPASLDSSSSDDEPDLDTLRAAVTTAPHSYEAHLALVTGARQAGDVNLLRTARESFAAAFPLPPSVWRIWLDDELRLADTPEAQRQILTTLYPLALADYLDVDLHLARLNLSISLHRAGTLPTDQVAEAFASSRRLAATAHFTAGHALWDAYRSFLAEAGIGDPAVIARELCEYADTPLRERADAGVDAPSGVRDACAVFEAKLEAATSEHPAVSPGRASDETVLQYRSYAAYARSVASVLALCVYERCVAESFLRGEVWLEYIRFCETLPVGAGHAWRASFRATRNVPWVLEVWVCALLAVVDTGEEVLGGGRVEKVCELLERAAPHVLASEDLGGAERVSRAAWTAFWALGAPEKAREAVWKTVDFNVEGSFHWASAVSHVAMVLVNLGEASAAEELMDRVVVARSGEARWWLAYARVLREAATEDWDSKVRELFSRGVESMSSAVELEAITDAWVTFESGKAGNRFLAARRVAHVYSVTGMQLEKVTASQGTDSPDRKREPKLGKKSRSEKGNSRNLPKRKRAKPAGGSGEGGGKESNGAGMENQKMEEAVNGDKMEGSASGVQADENAGAADKMEESPADNKTETANGAPGTEPRSEGKRPREIKQNEEKTSTEGQASRSTAGSAQGGSKGGSTSEGEVEPRTIFVNNLAFNVSESDLEAAFSFAGKISEIRLQRRRDGASKGRAYVEFDSDDAVVRALERHLRPIKGRAAWVRRSKPPARGARRQRGRGGGRGRGRGVLLQPRAVQRRVIAQVVQAPADGDVRMAEGEGSAGGEREKPKGQEEFRKLLLPDG